MADSRPSLIGGILKKPLIMGLILVFVVLVAGFVANFLVGHQTSKHQGSYQIHVNNLRSLSQEITKNMLVSAQGRNDVHASLADSKTDFANHLKELKGGSAASAAELNKIEALWAASARQIDVVLAHRDAFRSLKNNAADLVVTLSGMQDENSLVVADMLRFGMPPTQIARAQNQNLTIERMARSLQKIVDVGTTLVISEYFSGNLTNFQRVHKGMVEGDRELHLVAVDNTQILNRLQQVEALTQTVDASIKVIIQDASDVSLIRKAVQDYVLTSADYLNLTRRLAETFKTSPEPKLGSPVIGIGLIGAALLVMLVISGLIYREARNSSATQLRLLVSEINLTSDRMVDAIQHTETSIGRVSAASEQQDMELETVSGGVNEMATSIDWVSLKASESSVAANRSVGIANKGASVVRDSMDGMDRIRNQVQEASKRIQHVGECSAEIGDIVDLIDDISDQTNILSLNAAIQASMAGDAGKGFVVVADEVQRLAERSGIAAKKISALIETIQDDTHKAMASMEHTVLDVAKGTDLAEDSSVALDEIELVSAGLAESIGGIASAARQQADSAVQISQAVQGIQSQTTVETSTGFQGMDDIKNITDELRSSVAGFKLPD